VNDRVVMLRLFSAGPLVATFRATQSGDAVRLVCDMPPAPIHPQFVLALRREKGHLLADLRHKFPSVIDQTVLPQLPINSKEISMTTSKPKTSLMPLLKRTPVPAGAPLDKLDDSKGATESIRRLHKLGGAPLQRRNIYGGPK